MPNLNPSRKNPYDSIQLGKAVASQLVFDFWPSPRLAELQLPILLTPQDLADAFSIEPRKLQWLCYQGEKACVQHYHHFAIPKRSGGKRLLSAPKPLLKKTQEWIRSNLLVHLKPHPRVATAFRPGRSILDNAKVHCNKAIVIRIDLRDFFPSISYRRVKGIFQSCGYSEGIACILAILCTKPKVHSESDGNQFQPSVLSERALPQGACTSPDLANYLCRKLDYRIDLFARSLGFAYTRYADDLVFSHEQKRGKVDLLISKVYQIIRDEGFEPNTDKTMVMRKNSRQIVTGLVVNRTPKISRRDIRKFRAIAHQCQKLGYAQVSESLGRDAKQFLRGYISYASMINGRQANQLKGLCPADLFSHPNQESPTNREDITGSQWKHSDKNVARINRRINSHGNPETELINSIGMKFSIIPAGTFMMGSPETEKGRDIGELQHKVTITQSFYLGIFQVTEKQYYELPRRGFCYGNWNSDKPIMASWYDADRFCAVLSGLIEERKAGRVYRLPTEAEWEYACRAGSGTAFWFEDSKTKLNDYGRHHENSEQMHHPHPVAQKKSNPWGLFDMPGNVFEWCQDWYSGYPQTHVIDPVGPERGNGKVIRGGSHLLDSPYFRSAFRDGALPSHLSKYGRAISFRVVLTMPR